MGATPPEGEGNLAEGGCFASEYKIQFQKIAPLLSTLFFLPYLVGTKCLKL